MLGEKGFWKNIDNTMVPGDSPVTNSAYWKTAGMLIALVLLEGDSAYPVSPTVIYALLSNVREQSDRCAPMNLSLRFISQLQDSDSMARILLPWMIIPPGTDWTTLPEDHRIQIRDLLAGLGLEVSGKHPQYVLMVTAILQPQTVSTTGGNAIHIQWTAAIVAGALFGTPSFFSTAQFQGLLNGFRALLREEDDCWLRVGFVLFLNRQRMTHHKLRPAKTFVQPQRPRWE